MHTENHLVFIAGLHRSGTSLLHRILCGHPELSGFVDTGVPEDEGQHLQTRIPAGKVFGGPGRFGFDENSHMDESHPLCTPEIGAIVFRDWSPYWNLSRRYLVEKSPPNIVRTRFLQSLFPGASLVTTIRHPVAVSFSTQKWSRTSMRSLLEHWLVCHKKYFSDQPHLKKSHTLRYEELAADAQGTIDAIFTFLELESCPVDTTVNPNVNQRYFTQWNSLPERDALIDEFEHQFEPFAYSLRNL